MNFMLHKDTEDLILVCSCSALDHVVRFSSWHDEPLSPELYIEVSLSPERSLWKRIKTALMYLWKGRTCRFGCSAEVIIREEDVPRLKAWVDRVECPKTGLEGP